MRKTQLIVIHSSVWTLLILSGVLRGYFTDRLFGLSLFAFFVMTSAYYAISMICFYCSYFWVAPRLIIKRQYVLSFLLALLTLSIIVLARIGLEFWFLKPILHFDNYKGRIP